MHAAQGKSRKSEKAAKLNAADIMKASDEAARGGDPGRAMNFYMQAIELEPSAELWFRVG